MKLKNTIAPESITNPGSPMRKHRPPANRNGHTSKSIRIEFTHPTAAAVAIAGTFNDWRPAATQMVPLGDGHWVKNLALPPGTYEYRLVVDGAWMPDPRASDTTPNPFGELNSVLRVTPALAGGTARDLG